MADIRLKNLVKQYRNGVTAVQAVNLEVTDGEFLVLVGPSGCGKSTTLRMVAGLEEVTSGDIFIGDSRVNDIEPGKRNIAMVFQNYGLYPHMTVRQNMSFGLKMRKTPKSEIKQRVQEAAEILSIEPLLDRRPRELSGGQQQRVAVGRAIVRKPAAFLFDEPLSNLDAKLRVQMRTELARLHQRLKTTTIYVTHDQVEAMTLGDRIVVMNEGVIQQVDTPMELYHRPANRFVAGFIGSPPMNFVDGVVADGVFQAGAIRFPVDTDHAGDVTLGFRPEHISTRADDPVLAEVPLEVVERMGHETIVYCSVPGAVASGANQTESMQSASTVIRLDGNADVKAGDQLTLHLPAANAYLFERGELGQRIK